MKRVLISHLLLNPTIETVWFNEEGGWYFFEMPNCEAMSREDVLNTEVEEEVAVAVETDPSKVGVNLTDEERDEFNSRIAELEADLEEYKKANDELSAANDSLMHDANAAMDEMITEQKIRIEELEAQLKNQE